MTGSHAWPRVVAVQAAAVVLLGLAATTTATATAAAPAVTPVEPSASELLPSETATPTPSATPEPSAPQVSGLAPSPTTTPTPTTTPSVTPEATTGSVTPAAQTAATLATAQGPADPRCDVPRPATRGRLTLHPPRAPRGAPVLAVISGLERFPQQIVGGGSGEFFSFCFGSPFGPTDPGMGPVEGPVVVGLTVPEDAPLGRRQVEVVFSEGSGGSSAPDEARVWLATDFEVTAGTVALRPRDPSTPPCGSPAARAPSGRLTVTPAQVLPGRAVRVRVDEPPRELIAVPGTGGYYVVCLAGNAVVPPGVAVESADAPAVPLDVSIEVPPGTPRGRHDVQVLAMLPERDTTGWVGWTQQLMIGPATPRVPVGGVDAGGGALAARYRLDGAVLALVAVALGIPLAGRALARRRAG